MEELSVPVEIKRFVKVDFRKRKYVFFDDPPLISEFSTIEMVENRKLVKSGTVTSSNDDEMIIVENGNGVRACFLESEVSKDTSFELLDEIMTKAFERDCMTLFIKSEKTYMSLYLSDESKNETVELCKLNKDENLIANTLKKQIKGFDDVDPETLLNVLKKRKCAHVKWDDIKHYLTFSMVKNALTVIFSNAIQYK